MILDSIPTYFIDTQDTAHHWNTWTACHSISISYIFYVYLSILSSASYGPLDGLMYHWKMIITIHRIFIVCQSAFRHLNRYVATSEPTELGCDLFHVWVTPYLTPKKAKVLHPFSHRFLFLWTDTNKNQQLHHYLSTLAIHFVCYNFPYYIFHPFHPTLLFRTTIVDRYETTDPIR